MLQHAELDIEERATAPVTLDAFRDLLEWYLNGDPQGPGFLPPLCLGWDIHRKFGAEGFAIWRDLMLAYEPPLIATELFAGDQRTGTTSEQYEISLAESWALYDRQMHWTDTLIIDAMSAARNDGWEVCASEAISRTTDAILDDLALRSGAKRAAENAYRDHLEAERDRKLFARMDRYHALDDAAYTNWIAGGEPRGEALKYDRWRIRRLRENSGAAIRQTRPANGMPVPANYAPVASTQPVEPLPNLIKTSAEFVGSFVPPDYLIDGVLQRRYFYSLTAQTGVGKTAIAMRWAGHVVCGLSLHGLDVEKGTVLYFAGENPSDIQARWLVLTQEMRLDPATADIHFITGAMDLNQVAHRISAEVLAKGLNLALVIVDTAAAYNFGDDENSNTQAGNYARQLRSLTELPGGPCVVVLCHPTKRAADDDLTPRGGGAFLAEVDGNIALQKKDALLVASAQGKFRGAEFTPLRFELETIRNHPILKDVRGRSIPSVIAKPIAEGAANALETRTDRDAEATLAAVNRTPMATPTDLARALGWTFGPKSEPNVNRVKRNLIRLEKDKLVSERLGKWRTTQSGEKELNAMDRAQSSHQPPFPLPRTN